jgi:hypothetical protein
VIGNESGSAVNAPEIALRQIEAHRADAPGAQSSWRIGWEVENRAAAAIELLAARLPHGEFRSAEMRFVPPLELAPGARRQFEMAVRCLTRPDAATENAFAIFYVQYADASWRVFVRLRVVLDGEAVPQAATESITAQKIGFSGVSG